MTFGLADLAPDSRPAVHRGRYPTVRPSDVIPILEWAGSGRLLPYPCPPPLKGVERYR
jgi:hypothetical protein